MPMVGVVAIQGDFEKHIETLRRCDLAPNEILQVRTPEELAHVQKLIIPGGESTTVGKLMERFGLGEAIRERAAKGMPVWGTCMGMIMMAAHVEGRPDQYLLNLLDIDVERNAFGAQVHSFEDSVRVEGLDEPVPDGRHADADRHRLGIDKPGKACAVRLAARPVPRESSPSIAPW